MDSNRFKRRFPGVEEYIYPRKKQRIALYLDDYTPIKTVQVTNLEDYVCAGYLRAYFECKMGPVSNAIIKQKLEGGKDTRVGYVTFVMAEDAAESNCNANLYPDCKFMIKQADDAYQPKIDPNALKFEELNDDCLMHITSFLNLIDTINLCKTSSRLRSFIEQNIYQKLTHFTFDEYGYSSINKMNLPTVLQEVGKYFVSIEWICIKDKRLDQLSQYCKNAVTLNLVTPCLHLQSIRRNQFWLKNIESLKIQYSDLYDAHINAMITPSTQLKSLELIKCYNIRGKFLSEWKDSQLKYLRMVRCQRLSSKNITDFQRKSKMIKFSSDVFDSFVSCLTLPAACLYHYTALELAVNSSTDEKLEVLKFDELQQLTNIHLKCTFFNYRIDQDVTVAKSFNNIFVAMSAISSLNSITIDHIIVDGDTFKCLGSIQNLRELNLINIYNAVGQNLYSSLQVHLPKLTKLSMSMSNKNEQIDYKSICDIVFGLVYLKYFSHSLLTWQLLNKILDVAVNRRKQSPIEIGVPPMLFFSQMKVHFAAKSQGALKLSLVK